MFCPSFGCSRDGRFCYFFLSSVRNADRYSPFNVSTTCVLISSASAFGFFALASRMADLIRV